jgi:plastocyanin
VSRSVFVQVLRCSLGLVLVVTTACSGAPAEPDEVASVEEGPFAERLHREDEGGGPAPSDSAPASSSEEEEEELEPVWSDTLRIADRRYHPMTLLAGADRELTVVNEDDEAHTVTVFDGNLDVTVEPGERVEVTTPPEPGAYPVRCRFHDEMIGMIDVM